MVNSPVEPIHQIIPVVCSKHVQDDVLGARPRMRFSSFWFLKSFSSLKMYKSSFFV